MAGAPPRLAILNSGAAVRAGSSFGGLGPTSNGQNPRKPRKATNQNRTIGASKVSPA